MKILLAIEGNLTDELIDFIDNKLAELTNKSIQSDMPDEFGYFDSIEHLMGLGFVACQTYITAVYGIAKIDKLSALSLRPFHSSGVSIAIGVNAAANYWKHNNEWVLDKSPKQRRKIKETFEMIGFPVDIDYPLSGILTELSEPNFASFAEVMKKLKIWKKLSYQLLIERSRNKF